MLVLVVVGLIINCQQCSMFNPVYANFYSYLEVFQQEVTSATLATLQRDFSPWWHHTTQSTAKWVGSWNQGFHFFIFFTSWIMFSFLSHYEDMTAWPCGSCSCRGGWWRWWWGWRGRCWSWCPRSPRGSTHGSRRPGSQPHLQMGIIPWKHLIIWLLFIQCCFDI